MTLAFPPQKWLGRTAVRHVRVSQGLLDEFVALSGDRNPIHVDDSAARARGFPRRVVHGMLLGALVSQVVGMELPGENGVIQEIRLAFRAPCHPGDEIDIHLTVTEFFESVETMILNVKVLRQDGTLLAMGTVQSGLRSKQDVSSEP